MIPPNTSRDALRQVIRLQHQRRRRQALLTWLEHQLPDRQLSTRADDPGAAAVRMELPSGPDPAPPPSVEALTQPPHPA